MVNSPTLPVLPRLQSDKGAPIGPKCGTCVHWQAELAQPIEIEGKASFAAPCYCMPPQIVLTPVPALDLKGRPVFGRDGQQQMTMQNVPMRPIQAMVDQCGQHRPRI